MEIKTMSHVELKKKHSEDISNFDGLFFAFNHEQMEEGIKKVGATVDNKIVSIGAGGYILKSKLKDFEDMLSRHKQERKELKKNEKELIDAIVYELINHEYCITHDVDDALQALELTKEDVGEEVLKKAIKLHWLKMEPHL